MVINPLEKLSKVTLGVTSSSQDQASTSLDDFGIGTEESQTGMSHSQTIIQVPDIVANFPLASQWNAVEI